MEQVLNDANDDDDDVEQMHDDNDDDNKKNDRSAQQGDYETKPERTSPNLEESNAET